MRHLTALACLLCLGACDLLQDLPTRVAVSLVQEDVHPSLEVDVVKSEVVWTRKLPDAEGYVVRLQYRLVNRQRGESLGYCQFVAFRLEGDNIHSRTFDRTADCGLAKNAGFLESFRRVNRLD